MGTSASTSAVTGSGAVGSIATCATNAAISRVSEVLNCSDEFIEFMIQSIDLILAGAFVATIALALI